MRKNCKPISFFVRSSGLTWKLALLSALLPLLFSSFLYGAAPLLTDGENLHNNPDGSSVIYLSGDAVVSGAENIFVDRETAVIRNTAAKKIFKKENKTKFAQKKVKTEKIVLKKHLNKYLFSQHSQQYLTRSGKSLMKGVVFKNNSLDKFLFAKIYYRTLDFRYKAIKPSFRYFFTTGEVNDDTCYIRPPPMSFLCS